MHSCVSLPLRSYLPAAVVAVSCASLVLAPQGTAEPARTSKGAVLSLTSQQRAEHALNRLTFGPRPGEVVSLEHSGIDGWLDRQLRPDTIDDSVLEQRLQAYPALRLSQAELIRRFPSPAMLRIEERRGLAEPSDPVERAIYADAVAAYAARKQGKAEGSGRQTKVPDPQPADGKPAQAEKAIAQVEPALQSGETEAGMIAGVQTSQAGEADKTSQANQASRANQADGKQFDQSLAADMSAAEVKAVLDLPPGPRFARLVAMPPAQMLSFRAGLRGPDRLLVVEGLSPGEAESVEAMTTAPVRVIGAELPQARLLRDLFSERQLQAVMADFWLNHFNIYAGKNQNEPYLLPAFEREVILPHALGHFEDLLVATARSPAMLMYLDNWLNTGPDSPAAERAARLKARAPEGQIVKRLPEGINENYARELMELHTLGVNGGYTQKDVIEVAKCLTGWTIDRPYQGGEFRFAEARHEPGPKTVLGKTISPGGEREGMEVLHLLASSPATAHFLSQKLAVRFVSDAPPAALVDRMAATYLHTDGDIGAVLRSMVHSPEFFAKSSYKAKVKTPLEFITSAVRVSGAQVDKGLPLVGALDRLGMPLYGMQTPNGYSWLASEWVSSNALVSRMNLALVISGGRLPGTHPDWAALLGRASPAEASATSVDEARLELLLLGDAAAAQTRAAVLEGANDPTAQQSAQQQLQATAYGKAGMTGEKGEGVARLLPARTGLNTGAGSKTKVSAPESPVGTMAGLLLGSPDFQRR